MDFVCLWLLSLVTVPRLPVLWYGGAIGGGEGKSDIRKRQMNARAHRKEAANQPPRRVLRLAACATSAGLLFSFGMTLESLHYWLSAMGTGLLLAAGVDSDVFAVSDGRINRTRDGQFEVSTKEMRATIKGTSGQRLRVRFTYLGPTAETAKLADGSVRHQFVLALRAKNICNRLYIGWHFLGPSKHDQVVVQVKANRGQVSHAECGDSGYQTVATFSAPAARVNQEHRFEASIENGCLVVVTNEQVRHVPWPAAAFDFDGPAALRSDNARVIFAYEAE